MKTKVTTEREGKEKDKVRIKMQVDTANKIIKVESTVKISVLMKALKAMFPKGSPLGYYEEYSIDCNTVIQWYNYPVIVNPIVQLQKNWWETPAYQPSLVTPYPYEYGKPYCGDPPADQMPKFICDSKTNIGDVSGNGVYSVNVGNGSPVSCLNFDNGGVTNVVTKQPDFVTPTVFNVLLN